MLPTVEAFSFFLGGVRRYRVSFGFYSYKALCFHSAEVKHVCYITYVIWVFIGAKCPVCINFYYKLPSKSLNSITYLMTISFFLYQFSSESLGSKNKQSNPLCSHSTMFMTIH